MNLTERRIRGNRAVLHAGNGFSDGNRRWQLTIVHKSAVLDKISYPESIEHNMQIPNVPHKRIPGFGEARAVKVESRGGRGEQP